MSNDFELPPGWSLSDDMAKKVNEALSRKPRTTPLDELMDILGQTANEIAQVEPEPGDVAGWITHLLEVLQAEAQKDRKDVAYENMLLTLRESLETRVKGGKW